MTDDEIIYVKDVCKFFYPDDPPETEQITDKLADLMGKMLFDAIQASKILNLVPQAPGFKPGIIWLLTIPLKNWWRTKGSKDKIYDNVPENSSVEK
jgi:hypothetical protein